MKTKNLLSAFVLAVVTTVSSGYSLSYRPSGGGGGGSGTVSGAAGQIGYFGGATTITGSNSFFWNNASKRFGIGTITPSYTMDVSLSNASTGTISLQNTNPAGYSSMQILDANGVKLFEVGVGNDSAASYTEAAYMNLAGSLSLTGTGSSVIGSGTNTALFLNVNSSTYSFYTSSITAPNGYNVMHATIPWSVSVASGTGYNALSIPLGGVSLQSAVTITRIDAVALPTGATVLFQLDERTLATIGSAGSSVFTVSFATATSPGVSYTSFADSSIALGSQLVLTTHATAAGAGSPTALGLTIWYKEN